MDVVYFIVLVGVLIFVHELGHFAWAKFFDVKVLRFSLGFGPRLFGWRRGETEYVVSALPIGGYVKMLGESPHDVVSETDEPRAFQSQPLFKRFLIVVAGPAMNLLFPLLLFFVVYVGDSAMAPPVVGTVYPHRPAEGRLLPGDRILSIDSERTDTFEQVSRMVASHPGEELSFEVERDGHRVRVPITPVLTRTVHELDRVETVGRIGIRPYEPVPVIGVMSPDDPAFAAGLRTFDVIVSADGRRVDRWSDLAEILRGNRGASVPVTYLRPRRVGTGPAPLFDFEAYAPHVATLTPEPGPGSGVLRSGLEPADLYVSHVSAGSPEHALGLLPGDRLLTLDGHAVRMWATFIEDLKAGRGRSHELTWRRGGRVLSGTYRLRHEQRVDEFGQHIDRYAVGIDHWLPVRTEPPVDNPTPVRYAVEQAVERTGEMIELTVLSVVRLFEGRLTVKSIGGPITIFAEAGTAAREGTVNYLTLMAFISINLGLINLCPIPLLDGGHLLFFLVEGVIRRPVSVRVRKYASLVGLSILVLLMVLAVKNDIERHWPGSSGVTSSETAGDG